MTPLEYYQQALTTGRIRPDTGQLSIVEKLDVIFQALEYPRKNLLSRFRKKTAAPGLYMWGSVGIGKTFLMDCFYHCLTIPKMRLHFHQFMLRTHQALQQVQGQKNPLALIAKQIALEAKVICFDEFFVSNIADAMILGELFLHLFDNGVTLITSSNVAPDLLYKEGIQRERFLPAIELIKANTEVVHLHSKTDYRLIHLQQAGVFYSPLDADAQQNMEHAFTHFSHGVEAFHEPITLCDRTVSIVKRAGSVIWFDFAVLCGRPRCQNDYLALTQQFHTILVQNLRAIQPQENDLILSFIYLVDILYDAHCRLVISSEVAIDNIYSLDQGQQPFARTLSRLIEMQSEAYVYPKMSEKFITNL